MYRFIRLIFLLGFVGAITVQAATFSVFANPSTVSQGVETTISFSTNYTADVQCLILANEQQFVIPQGAIATLQVRLDTSSSILCEDIATQTDTGSTELTISSQLPKSYPLWVRVLAFVFSLYQEFSNPD